MFAHHHNQPLGWRMELNPTAPSTVQDLPHRFREQAGTTPIVMRPDAYWSLAVVWPAYMMLHQSYFNRDSTARRILPYLSG